MKRLMALSAIALSLNLNVGAIVYGGRQNLSGVPTPQVQQRVNPSLHHGGMLHELPTENKQQGATPQEITFINNTDEAIVAFVKKDKNATMGLLIPVQAKQTRSVALPEFYWLEKKGTGFGKPSMPQEVLMHSFATIAEISGINQATKTSVELNTTSNNITIGLDGKTIIVK